jgi:hypothetical protein
MKFQYWMPAALPLISCLVVLLPEDWKKLHLNSRGRYLAFASILIVMVQFSLSMTNNIGTYIERVNRAENNPRIAFFHHAENALASLPQDEYALYYDYRLYVPDMQGYSKELNYVLLEYGYLQDKDFDVLLLLQQRINDYIHPDVTGIDPVQFAQNQRFYLDANNGTITGYHLIYRDEIGLVFVRENLYEEFY